MGIRRAEIEIDAAKVRELLSVQHPDLASLSLVTIPSGWDKAILRLPRRQLAAALVLHEQRWLPQLARFSTHCIGPRLRMHPTMPTAVCRKRSAR